MAGPYLGMRSSPKAIFDRALFRVTCSGVSVGAGSMSERECAKWNTSERTWQDKRKMIRDLDEGAHVSEEVRLIERATAFRSPVAMYAVSTRR